MDDAVFPSLPEDSWPARVLGDATEDLIGLCTPELRSPEKTAEHVDRALTVVELVLPEGGARTQAAALLIRNSCERILLFECLAPGELDEDRPRAQFVRRAIEIIRMLMHLSQPLASSSVNWVALASFFESERESLLDDFEQLSNLLPFSSECTEAVRGPRAPARARIISFTQRAVRAIQPPWVTDEGELSLASAAANHFELRVDIEEIELTLKVRLRRLGGASGQGMLTFEWTATGWPDEGFELQLWSGAPPAIVYRDRLQRREGRTDITDDELGFDPWSAAIWFVIADSDGTGAT